jgi:hypothetical protein
MKAEVVRMNADKAKSLLLRNKNNRALNENTVDNYVREMNAGRWKENGESIIIDNKGLIKDGQHRLSAIVKANYTCKVVLVTDVEPNVMESIDIGKNRSLSDVLYLNGFKKYNANLSVCVKSIMLLDRNYIGSKISKAKGGTQYISNGAALDYTYKNEKDLYRIIEDTHSIYCKSKKVLKHVELVRYLYLICGKSFNYTEYHLDFIRSLAGLDYKQGKATAWVYDKFYNYKINKITVSTLWKDNAVIKAWNTYTEGNPDISFIRVSTDRLEQVNVL